MRKRIESSPTVFIIGEIFFMAKLKTLLLLATGLFPGGGVLPLFPNRGPVCLRVLPKTTKWPNLEK